MGLAVVPVFCQMDVEDEATRVALCAWATSMHAGVGRSAATGHHNEHDAQDERGTAHTIRIIKSAHAGDACCSLTDAGGTVHFRADGCGGGSPEHDVVDGHAATR